LDEITNLAPFTASYRLPDFLSGSVNGMYIVAVKIACMWCEAVQYAVLVIQYNFGHFIVLLIEILFENNEIVVYTVSAMRKTQVPYIHSNIAYKKLYIPIQSNSPKQPHIVLGAPSNQQPVLVCGMEKGYNKKM
jgi:hypothetical protein